MAPPHDWGLRLGLRLLAERVRLDTTFYKPYIDALPAQYPTFPLFYDQAITKLLEYRPLNVEVHKMYQTLSNLAKAFSLPDDIDFSKLNAVQKCVVAAYDANEVQLGDLAWGMLSAKSRAFDFPLGVSSDAVGSDASTTTPTGLAAAHGYTKCLVPLIDMLNHSFTPNCQVTVRFDSPDGSQYDANNPAHRQAARFVLTTTQPVPRGGELTISYTKPGTNAVLDDIPQLNAENEAYYAEKISTTSDIQELFKLSLLRVPGLDPGVLKSSHNNDKLLQDYGFVPTFNFLDDISLNPDKSLFDTALSLGGDITIGHSYLSEVVGGNSKNKTQQVKVDKKFEEQHGTVADQPPMTGIDNDFDTALVKVVLPTPQQLSEDQHFLLHSLFQDPNMKLSLDWSGPNKHLLGICRLIALGTHQGDVDRIAKARAKNITLSSGNAQENDAEIQNDIISNRWSEDQVHGAVEYTSQKLFNLAQKRALAILATSGEELPPSEEEMTGQQLFRGFCDSPLSPENEMGAMVVLYHTLVLGQGGFTTPIKTNVEGYYKGLVNQRPAEATAHLFSHSKKLLITHALKTLATRIGLDSPDNKTHFWHNRLEQDKI
eukprot:UN00431